MTTPSTPPGWYPDPAGGPGQRFWNGTAWGEVTVGLGQSGNSPKPALPQSAKPGLSKGMKIGLGVGAGALALFAIGSIGNSSNNSSTKTLTSTRYADAPAITTTEALAPRVGPMTSIDEDGTYLVGEDIAPGQYRADGTGGSCYWARLSGLGGSVSEIITSGLEKGQQLVQIQPTDVAFKTQRCGVWEKIG